MSAEEQTADKQGVRKRVRAWTNEIDWPKVAGIAGTVGAVAGGIALKRWGDKVYDEAMAERAEADRTAYRWTDKNRWE